VQHPATRYNALQRQATEEDATHCNSPQHNATPYNTLKHTASHCNTPQHTTTPDERILAVA